jgi:hypothetical protein
MLWVTDAKHVGGYRLWMSFNDGTSGEVDLSGQLQGEIFEPLRDLHLFRQVRFDPEMDTVVWPNGANLDPEFLHDAMIEQGGIVDRQVSPPPSHVTDDAILFVTAAKYLGDYRVWLQFSDGSSGEADLLTALRGPMFELLKDKAVFSQVRLDPEMDTIAWPNGADLAPEYLKELVAQQSSVRLKAS